MKPLIAQTGRIDAMRYSSDTDRPVTAFASSCPSESKRANHRARPFGSICQDPQSLIFMGPVYIAACVDQNVLALRDEFAFWKRAVTTRRIGRQKVSHLARRGGCADVVNPQTGVEVGEIDEIALRLHERIVQQRVLVVRAEPAAALA